MKYNFHVTFFYFSSFCFFFTDIYEMTETSTTIVVNLSRTEKQKSL